MRRAALAIAPCLALAGAPLLVAGCGGSEPAATAPAGEVVRYTTRGQIVALPSPDSPAAELQIRHEPVPDFRSGGKVVGMRSMTMPFPIGEGVSLDGLEAGDKVEMTFETVYSPDTGMVESFRIVALVELPAETELVFEEQAQGDS